MAKVHNKAAQAHKHQSQRLMLLFLCVPLFAVMALGVVAGWLIAAPVPAWAVLAFVAAAVPGALGFKRFEKYWDRAVNEGGRIGRDNAPAPRGGSSRRTATAFAKHQ